MREAANKKANNNKETPTPSDNQHFILRITAGGQNTGLVERANDRGIFNLRTRFIDSMLTAFPMFWV